MAERIELVRRLDLIRDLCDGKSVLHLGCTNNPYTDIAIESNTLLHFELQKLASELYGFDFDQAGLDTLASHGSTNLHKADLEHLNDVDLEKTFDVIVAGEMIEHLDNPGLFLDGIKRFMRPDTLLVITTINAYCGLRFFQYGFTRGGAKTEPVHPDHVAYYSYSTLSLLVRRHNLDVDRFLFYDLGDEHRPTTRRALRLINDICVWFAPQYSDGVIAVCRLKSD